MSSEEMTTVPNNPEKSSEQRPEDGPVECSIVILSYNTAALLRRCIATLLAHGAGVSYEIIVVDNASRDGSAEMVLLEFPHVRLVRSPVNVGFAAGVNLGLRVSRGRFLLVMNSDVIVQPGAVEGLVSFLRDTNHVDIAAAGPLILNADGSTAPSARPSTRSVPMTILAIIDDHWDLHWLVPRWLVRSPGVRALLARLHSNFADHSTIREAEVIDGMCVMFKRRVLEEVGLFDEQFFFDYEIVDLCNRIRRSGFKLLFYPGVSVIHLGHQSRNITPGILLETSRSYLIFTAKHHPQRVAVVRGCIAFVALLDALLWKVKVGWSLLRGHKGVEARTRYQLFVEIVRMAIDFDRQSVEVPGRVGWR